MVDLSAIGQAPVFHVPQPFYFGKPTFDVWSILLMIIISIVSMVESTGVYFALGDITGQKVGEEELKKGYRAEGLAVILGGIFNTFPYTGFSQNVGLVQLSGIKTRKPIYFSAIFLIILGLFPKIGALAQIIPEPVLGAGMNAMVAIFGIAWMGDTFFNGNLAFFKEHIANVVTQYPFLFAIALFFMSIMLFSQAATVRTLYPLGIGLGIAPLALVAMFPAVNGYFFLPNYPTTVAAINFDRTGSTRIGRFVVNHSFQLAGFITTFVSIGVGYLIIQFM